MISDLLAVRELLRVSVLPWPKVYATSATTQPKVYATSATTQPKVYATSATTLPNVANHGELSGL